MAGRKANFQWEAGPSVAGHIFGNIAASSVSFASIFIFERAMTIRRCIVDFWAQNPSVTDNAAMGGRVGLIVVAPQVVAVGATAVPRPITDRERPWLWNRAFASKQQFAGTDFVKYIPLHLHDDVRGMRKVKERDIMICVMETGAGSSVDTFQSVRFLTST